MVVEIISRAIRLACGGERCEVLKRAKWKHTPRPTAEKFQKTEDSEGTHRVGTVTASDLWNRTLEARGKTILQQPEENDIQLRILSPASAQSGPQ